MVGLICTSGAAQPRAPVHAAGPAVSPTTLTPQHSASHPLSTHSCRLRRCAPPAPSRGWRAELLLQKKFLATRHAKTPAPWAPVEQRRGCSQPPPLVNGLSSRGSHSSQSALAAQPKRCIPLLAAGGQAGSGAHGPRQPFAHSPSACWGRRAGRSGTAAGTWRPARSAGCCPPSATGLQGVEGQAGGFGSGRALQRQRAPKGGFQARLEPHTAVKEEWQEKMRQGRHRAGPRGAPRRQSMQRLAGQSIQNRS